MKSHKFSPNYWAIGAGVFFCGLILGTALSQMALYNKPLNIPLTGATYPPSEGRVQCQVLVCSNGKTFPTCACTDATCAPVAYFSDPCTQFSQEETAPR